MFEVAATYLQKRGLVDQNWQAFMLDQGIKVALFRDYYDGYHRQRLSREMRNLLQLDFESDRYAGFSRYGGYTLFDSFNANYCDMVVNTMADRMAIDRVEPSDDMADNAGALDWIAALVEDNRLDALQIAVHIAALRDGVAWVMVDWNADEKRPQLVYEPAWDGYTGVCGVYDSTGQKLAAAIKVWDDGQAQQKANVYLPDEIVRFPEGERDDDAPGDSQEMKYMGIPLVPFGGDTRSELANIIPLQDSLNNTLASMVATGLRSGFPIMFAKQFPFPKSIGPGQAIEAGFKNKAGQYRAPEGQVEAAALASILSNVSLEKIDAGEITTLAEAAEFFIDQISTVSSTPVPKHMGGDSQSGEALKQRETRLLGKLRRARIQYGNNWEDVLRMANLASRTYGGDIAPTLESFAIHWVNPEVRNDMEIRELAKQLHEWGFTKEALRIVSAGSIVDYDEEYIDKLLEEQKKDEGNRVPLLGDGGLPDFSGGEAEGLDAIAAPPQDEVLA